MSAEPEMDNISIKTLQHGEITLKPLLDLDAGGGKAAHSARAVWTE